MKALTVITTTFNRAYCLHQVYESLMRQDSDDFCWLVVDDGSTDDTGTLVAKWIKEGRVEIEYVYRPNGGMHAARNTAYERCRTELNVIIDSDDWLADNMLGRVLDFWRAHKTAKTAGIITLNADPGGAVIGTAMPQGVGECTVGEFFGKHGGKGDKKLFYRSELTRLYPYPEFEGEKFFPASYKFRMLDLDYTMLLLDCVTCIVDYNPDSMSLRKYDQYRSCARGFAFYRNELLRITPGFRSNLRTAVHYVAESALAGEKHPLRKAAKKAPVAAALLPGALLRRRIIAATEPKGNKK